MTRPLQPWKKQSLFEPERTVTASTRRRRRNENITLTAIGQVKEAGLNVSTLRTASLTPAAGSASSGDDQARRPSILWRNLYQQYEREDICRIM